MFAACISMPQNRRGRRALVRSQHGGSASLGRTTPAQQAAIRGPCSLHCGALSVASSALLAAIL